MLTMAGVHDGVSRDKNDLITSKTSRFEVGTVRKRLVGFGNECTCPRMPEIGDRAVVPSAVQCSPRIAIGRNMRCSLLLGDYCIAFCPKFTASVQLSIQWCH